MRTAEQIDIALEHQIDRLDRRFMNDESITQEQYDAAIKVIYDRYNADCDQLRHSVAVQLANGTVYWTK